MSQEAREVPLLVRREIEAGIAVPLIKAFMEELGRERALEVARRVIESLAEESGRMLAQVVGGNSLEHFGKAAAVFSKGGASESQVIEASPNRLLMNITKCRYVDVYKELGMHDFGYLLSCGRDFAMIRGFNPKIKFTRTKTIMEGDDHCDFVFELEE